MISIHVAGFITNVRRQELAVGGGGARGGNTDFSVGAGGEGRGVGASLPRFWAGQKLDFPESNYVLSEMNCVFLSSTHILSFCRGA